MNYHFLSLFQIDGDTTKILNLNYPANILLLFDIINFSCCNYQLAFLFDFKFIEFPYCFSILNLFILNKLLNAWIIL